MTHFVSYVTDNASLGSFLNVRYSDRSYFKWDLAASGTTGSCVVLVQEN